MAPFSHYKPWHALVLGYGLLLLALVGVLAWLERPEAEPVSLTEVVASVEQGETRLTIEGKGFLFGLRGLLAETAVADDARQWLFLQNVLLRNFAISAGEDLAVVSSSRSKLISLSLAKGRAPVVLGSLEMPAHIEMIRIIGDWALVGLRGPAGIALVDLRDPQSMRLVTVFGPTVGFMDMVVDGQLVYLVDRFLGLGVLDLAAESPQITIVDAPEAPWRIAMADKRLVVGTLTGAVQLYEVLDSGQVKKTGVFSLSNDIRDVALVKETLAVAVKSHLYLYDMSNWPKLEPLADIPLPGAAMKMSRVPGRDLLVISLVASGVCLVDVSRPAQPVIAGHLTLPQTYYDLVVREETIYASGSGGFEAFSLETIAGDHSAVDAQKSRDVQSLLSWNGQVFGYKDERLTLLATDQSQPGVSMEPFLAVADDDRVVFYSRADDGSTSLLPLYPVRRRGLSDALWQKDRLYLVHAAGLDVLRGPRPEALLPAGSLALKGIPVRLKSLEPGLLLVVTKTDGILIVDVSNPGQPVVHSTLPTLTHRQRSTIALDVLVANQRAYVSLGDGGVNVFDISKIDQPRLLQMIDTPGTAIGLARYDDLLLVADGMQGVFMIDIRDPAIALPIGSLLAPLRAKKIAVADDGLLVSSQPGGTAKLPLPQRLSALQIINNTEAVALVDGQVSRAQVHLYDARGPAQIKVVGGE